MQRKSLIWRRGAGVSLRGPSEVEKFRRVAWHTVGAAHWPRTPTFCGRTLTGSFVRCLAWGRRQGLAASFDVAMRPSALEFSLALFLFPR